MYRIDMLLVKPGLLIFSFIFSQITFASNNSCLEEMVRINPEMENIVRNTEIEINNLDRTDSYFYDKIYEQFVISSEKSLTSHNLGNYTEGVNSAIKSSIISNYSEQWNQTPYLAIADSRLGLNLSKLDQLDLSIKCHLLAYEGLTEVVKKNKDYESHLAWEENNLGALYRRVGDFEESLRFLKISTLRFRALSSKENSKYTDYYLNSLAEQALLYLDQREYRSAKNIMETYLKKFEITGTTTPAYEAFAREVFARIYIKLNKYREAENQIKLAKKLLSEMPKNYYLNPLLDFSLSKIYRLQGKLDSALKISKRGLNSVEESRTDMSDKLYTFNRLESNIEGMYANYFDLINDKYQNSQLEILLNESILFFQNIDLKSHKYKINIVTNGKDNFINRKDKEITNQYSIKRNECNELIQKWIKYGHENPKINFDDLKISFWRSKLNICQLEAENLKKKKYSSKKVINFINPSSLNVQEIQNSIRTKEGLFSFFFSSTKAFVWLITKESIDFHEVKMDLENLTKLRNSLRKTLSLNKNLQRLESFDQEASHEIYTSLFLPFKEKLMELDSLIMVKNNFFNRIPFSILIFNLDNPKEPKWLFQKFNINNIYSISELKNRNNGAVLGNFYGFGDPLPKDKLDRLDNAELELKSLSQGFVSPWENVFLREKATKDKLSSISFNNGVLAFATHAVKPYQLSGIKEPSLLMDDWLGAKEIAFGLDINASLVLLSACETSWSSTNYKIPILDLPTAFLLSGSNSVVVSNWDIEDKATKDIMVEAADYIYKNSDKDYLFNNAIRHGMNNYIERNRKEKYSGIDKAHPFFWAPFEIIGLTN